MGKYLSRYSVISPFWSKQLTSSQARETSEVVVSVGRNDCGGPVGAVGQSGVCRLKHRPLHNALSKVNLICTNIIYTIYLCRSG